MNWIWSERNTDLQEKMDDPDSDRQKLFNTYSKFWLINRLITQWKRVYNQWLLPGMETGQTYTLLDIGFGGGDIAENMARWSLEDGIDLHITAIDTDHRALEYIEQQPTNNRITYRQVSLKSIAERRERFDFVISNHLLHHLDTEELPKLMETTRHITRQRVIFNDIHRHDLAYLSFGLLTLGWTRNSFIREDGLTSIRRSFTANELRSQVSGEWSVHTLFPFRLLLTYDASNDR